MGDDQSVDRDALDEVLVEAIQDGRLREELTATRWRSVRLTTAAECRLAEIETALTALDSGLAAETDRLGALLADVGIDAEVCSGDRDGRPLQIVTIGIGREDADHAVAALESAGYRCLGPSGSAARRARYATGSGCELVAVDTNPVRVEVGWPPPRLLRGVLGRLLVPGPTDLETMALPARLWPLYSLIRLTRLPRRWWRRRSGRVADPGPYLATPDALVEPLLQVAGLGADDVLVDLGCGDARILIRAVETFGCRAVGIEIDPAVASQARRAVVAAGLEERIRIVIGDALDLDLTDADVIVAFLPCEIVQRIVPVVLASMRAGARLVVHEQTRLDLEIAADVRRPLITSGGVSVAHCWTR